MGSSASMPRILAAVDSQTVPRPESRQIWGQLSMNLGDLTEWRDEIYKALTDTVEAFWGKHFNFADEVGKPTAEVSLRLRRGEDSKGYAQVAPLDWLAVFAQRLGALEFFTERLAVLKGNKVESARPLTDAEKLRLLVADMTDKQKRRFEKENGMQPGELDR